MPVVAVILTFDCSLPNTRLSLLDFDLWGSFSQSAIHLEVVDEREKRMETHHLSVYLQPGHTKEPFGTRLVVECNETKALAPTRIAVHHNSCVDDFTVLGEVLAEAFGGDRRCESSHKHLNDSLVLCARDSAFGINLQRVEGVNQCPPVHKDIRETFRMPWGRVESGGGKKSSQFFHQGNVREP